MTDTNDTKPTHHVIIFQRPNPPLIIMLIGFAVLLFTHGLFGATAETVFVVAGVIWSYQEISSGVNRFRKGLGIMTLIVVSLILLVSVYYQ
jgi:hypothetical protein